MAHTETRSPFGLWLEAKLGTRNWVVAQRLTAGLKAKGYELAVSRKRFTELRQAFAAERA